MCVCNLVDQNFNQRGALKSFMSRTFLLDFMTGLILFISLIGFHILTSGMLLPAMDFYQQKFRMLRELILKPKDSNFVLLIVTLFVHMGLPLICVVSRGFLDEKLTFMSSLIISAIPGIISLLLYLGLELAIILFPAKNSHEGLSQVSGVIGAAPSTNTLLLTPSANKLLLTNIFLSHFANSLVLMMGGSIGWILFSSIIC
jgi:hypothetical protein